MTVPESVSELGITTVGIFVALEKREENPASQSFLWKCVPICECMLDHVGLCSIFVAHSVLISGTFDLKSFCRPNYQRSVIVAIQTNPTSTNATRKTWYVGYAHPSQNGNPYNGYVYTYTYTYIYHYKSLPMDWWPSPNTTQYGPICHSAAYSVFGLWRSPSIAPKMALLEIPCQKSSTVSLVSIHSILCIL